MTISDTMTLDGVSAKIDDFVEDVRAHWRIPGLAVAVVFRGRPVHVKAYGVRDLHTQAPMDVDTAIAVGSCSKAFTASAAATLVDAGTLRWDDAVRRYLPAFRLYDAWITEHLTLRDLLAHRVGLSRASLSEHPCDLPRAEILRRVQAIPPVAAFRDRFSYSNVGYLVAAEVIAAAAGQPFETVVEERLFRPLAMTRSTVANRPWERQTNLAAAHHEVGGRLHPVPQFDLANFVGAASIYLTMREAVAWLLLQLGDGAYQGRRIVSPESLAEMQRLQVAARPAMGLDGVGLGWFILQTNRGRALWHDGWVRGTQARIVLFPTQQFGCLVATNRVSPAHLLVPRVVQALVQGEDGPDLVAQCDQDEEAHRRRQRAQFTEERCADPERGSPWSLDAFVGTYRHGGLGTVRITRSANEGLWLSVDHASDYAGPLVRYGGRLFEYHGDLEAGPLPVAATPAVGEKPRLRFRVAEDRVVGFEWEDMWFGNASLVRDTHVGP